MRTIPTLLTAFLVVTALSSAESQEPEKVDCLKDLEKAYEFIDDAWSFEIFKPGYVDLEREFKRLEQQARRAERPVECADIIAQFMSTLGDGHSSLQHYPGVKYTRPAIELRTIRERLSPAPGVPARPHVYVVSRDTTDEALSEILPGSEIVSIDGKPVEEVHEYWMNRVSGSTDQWRDYMCDRRLLLGPADEPVELELKAPSGRLANVTVPRRPWIDEDAEVEEYEIYKDTATIARGEFLDGGWGYLKLTTFSFINTDSTVRRFDEAMAGLVEAPGLIVDVRGNGGGLLDAFNAISGRFINQEEILAYFQVRQPGQEGVYEMMDWRTGDEVT
ncbi:MAG TPA: S41 family peptidase, partial [Gemmatimonadota bacterium]|nr:S41 family peptidase [Gemmatimonadota bacterium]